jgi:hypothetical protein
MQFQTQGAIYHVIWNTNILIIFIQICILSQKFKQYEKNFPDNCRKYSFIRL